MLNEIVVPTLDPKDRSQHELAKKDVKRLLNSCALNLYLHQVGLYDKRFVDMTESDIVSYAQALLVFTGKN